MFKNKNLILKKQIKFYIFFHVFLGAFLKIYLLSIFNKGASQIIVNITAVSTLTAVSVAHSYPHEGPLK